MVQRRTVQTNQDQAVQLIIILTSTLLCDIVQRCNMDDLTALLHTTAASSNPQVDPGEPLLPDATLVLKVDMRKEAHQSLGGSHGRYTLPLQERWSVTKFCISCEVFEI